MLPFLGIDLTANKKNEEMNGSEFLVQKPSVALEKTLEASTDNVEQTIQKSKLPLPFRVVQYICSFATLILVGGLLKADVSFAEGYQNAPGLYWAAGICAIIWFILWIWSKNKSKTVLETHESEQRFSHLEHTANAIYTELSVPADAKDVDILFFYYKVKDGEIKVHEKPMQLTQYFNPEFKLFTDEENLYLANLEGKYAFPLSSIVKLHTVKKHIRIAGWNKDRKHDTGIYKQYKLTVDNYGCIHCKQYHILEINRQGESYGIYFPSYELPVFEECIK